MNRSSQTLSFLLTLALCLASARRVPAQTATTGALSGIVTDASGGVLPGAAIEATHQPTGTRYTAVTGTDGRFSLLNVRVGGPYAITVSMSGFKPETLSGVRVALGEERTANVQLDLDTMTESLDVTAQADSIISPSRMGPASNVSQDAIETLPTVARAIQDFARVSPYFVSSGESGTADSLSVAGRNNRYNNIQIDGAVNNDLFGISESGTPGGQTEAQPVSLDAIQELQLAVSSYDVRYGGFSGGLVNAITKSGANTFSGTVYFYNQNESLVGDGPARTPIARFGDKQYGATLGGPIVKDKAFFFVNADFGRRERPAGVSVDGASGQVFQGAAEVDRFLSILQNRYGYDPGDNPKAEFVRSTPNDKFIAKLDFNLDDRHRLQLRHNVVRANNDIGTPNTRLYIMPDAYYEFRDTTHSTVLKLNSTLGGTAVNEAILTFQRIRDQRNGPTRFPSTLVDVTSGVQIRFGREAFSAANELDQDVLEVSDHFTFFKGKHTVSIGTHNELFRFRNLFIRDNFGSYRFANLDLFEQGLAQQFDHSYSATADAQQAAEFGVNQLGLYASDLWRVKPRLTLNFGVRLDLPTFPDKPTANPAAVANFGFATDVVPSPAMISPMLGFNWATDEESRSQLSGGIGIFSGRTPYVWLSNQYGNTGIEFNRIGASFNANNRIPFVTDPDHQPRTVTGAGAGSFTNEIDVVDPDYKFPQLLRTSLSYDRHLPGQLIGTVEGFYSKTLQDIAYANLNLRQTATRPDGRPLHARANTTFSDVILLKNSGQGYQWSVMTKLERRRQKGLAAMASWLYGDSQSVMDGTSSQAASNWGLAYTQGDPNAVTLGRSRFSTGHRVIASVSYDWKIRGRVNLGLTAFYNGQSGRPYSFVYFGDFNGDGRTGNDLMYVPAVDDPKVTFINGTAADFENYVANDKGLQKYRGQILERGAARAPWTNTLDLKALLGAPVRRLRFEVGLDILNVLNLLDHDWGVVDYATFNDLGAFPAPTVNAAGQMVYNLATITNPTYVKFDRDDLRSRWRGQLSFRVRF